MSPRHLIAATAAALAVASCTEDPVAPGASSSASSRYQPRIEFYSSFSAAIWGLGDDVYAFGDAVMRLGADGEWTPVPVPLSFDSPDNVWGSEEVLYAWEDDRVYRFDGNAWTSITVPRNIAWLEGTADGDVFALGQDGRLHHYDGTAWSVDSLYADALLHYLTVGGPDDVYAGGDGMLFHFDGSDWTLEFDEDRNIQALWKCPDGPLYMASEDSLFTFDGVTLKPEHVGLDGIAWVGGRSAAEVYCVGYEGFNTTTIASFDGGAWTTAGVVPAAWITSLWGDRARDRLYVGTLRHVFQVEPATSTPVLGVGAPIHGFEDLWVSEQGNVYAIGEQAFRYDGGEWVSLGKEMLTRSVARSLWGRSEREIYAVGSGMILHYDGELWTAVSGGAPYRLSSVAGNGRNVFAVGERGAVLGYDGRAWTRMESGTTAHLFGVYAWDDGAFAVGENGRMVHYDGREWRTFRSPVGWTILDVFGFGPDEIYAVGQHPNEICRFDGRRWSPEEIGLTSGYNQSVWGTSPRNLFVGQTNGNVLHFDGRSWSSLPFVMTISVRGVGASRDGDVFAATQSGIVHYSR